MRWVQIPMRLQRRCTVVRLCLLEGGRRRRQHVVRYQRCGVHCRRAWHCLAASSFFSEGSAPQCSTVRTVLITVHRRCVRCKYVAVATAIRRRARNASMCVSSRLNDTPKPAPCTRPVLFWLQMSDSPLTTTRSASGLVVGGTKRFNKTPWIHRLGDWICWAIGGKLPEGNNNLDQIQPEPSGSREAEMMLVHLIVAIPIVDTSVRCHRHPPRLPDRFHHHKQSQRQ